MALFYLNQVQYSWNLHWTSFCTVSFPKKFAKTLISVNTCFIRNNFFMIFLIIGPFQNWCHLYCTHLEQICSLRNITSINFSVKPQEVGLPLFSDVKICRKNVKFVASVKRMTAGSGIFVSYESFISMYQKRGLSYTILGVTLRICCKSKQFICKLTI